MQNIHLIVTSRPWKADELLNVDKYKYQKVDMPPKLMKENRDAIISNFYPNSEKKEELISFIEMFAMKKN